MSKDNGAFGYRLVVNSTAHFVEKSVCSFYKWFFVDVSVFVIEHPKTVLEIGVEFEEVIGHDFYYKIQNPAPLCQTFCVVI